MPTTRKGQYAVVEQVVLFALGVAIISGFLVTFDDFGREVKDDAMEEQTELFAQKIGMDTQFLVSSRANGEVTVSLPETLAGEDYFVNFTEDGIAVQVDEQSHLTTAYGLPESYTLEGSISSDIETAVISKQQNTLTIGSP